jgi:valyl-tRNA synthetase
MEDLLKDLPKELPKDLTKDLPKELRKEFPKEFPINQETLIYDNWCSKELFTSKINDQTPYTILQPPPNVTGNLHIGHALNNTYQDILIRFHKMQN